MFEKKRLVYLPKVTPAVALPLRLADLLEIIIDAGSAGVTTLELHQASYLNPSIAISKLRKRGAVISTARCEAIGHQGKLHKRIARYTFDGWDSATEWDDLISNCFGATQ